MTIHDEQKQSNEEPSLDIQTTLELYREAFYGMKQKISDLEEVIEEYGQEKLLEPSLKSVLIQARTALEDCVGRTAKDEIYRQAALNNLTKFME